VLLKTIDMMETQKRAFATLLQVNFDKKILLHFFRIKNFFVYNIFNS